MTPAAQKALETRRRNRERWEAKLAARRAEEQTIRTALMAIVKNPDATPGQVLEAVQQMERMGIH